MLAKNVQLVTNRWQLIQIASIVQHQPLVQQETGFSNVTGKDKITIARRVQHKLIAVRDLTGTLATLGSGRTLVGAQLVQHSTVQLTRGKSCVVEPTHLIQPARVRLVIMSRAILVFI